MISLEEAIKHCEEVAKGQDYLAKRCDDASGYTRSHNEAIRTEEAKKHCECASEHRQLAEWLRELQGYKADRVCCEFCKYQDRLEHERPCSLCKHNFMDMFEREVKADE